MNTTTWGKSQFQALRDERSKRERLDTNATLDLFKTQCMVTFRVFWLFEDFPGFSVVAAMALLESSHFFQER